jgi:hypothetical protein
VSAHAEGVEWAEVSVSNLIEENRQLTGRLAEREKEDVIALALWDGAVRELVKQRDLARSIAVRLEAELAVAERALEVTAEDVVDTATTAPERCPDRTSFGMSTIWCEREPHPDGSAHRWGDLTWPA